MTTHDPNPQTPAGWYPAGSEQRYWDGSAWTNHTVPLIPDAAPSPSDQPQYGQTQYGQTQYRQPGSHPVTAITAAPGSDTSMAMLAHLLGLFTGFLGPLIIFLVKKNDDQYVRQQASEALNFQLTLIIAAVVSLILILVVIGLLLILVVAIYGFVFAIIGTVAANKGEPFRYPVSIRFVS